jgi:hypothetical protein
LSLDALDDKKGKNRSRGNIRDVTLPRQQMPSDLFGSKWNKENTDMQSIHNQFSCLFFFPITYWCLAFL